jgi:hypothetical protein
MAKKLLGGLSTIAKLALFANIIGLLLLAVFIFRTKKEQPTSRDQLIDKLNFACNDDFSDSEPLWAQYSSLDELVTSAPFIVEGTTIETSDSEPNAKLRISSQLKGRQFNQGEVITLCTPADAMPTNTKAILFLRSVDENFFWSYPTKNI